MWTSTENAPGYQNIRLSVLSCSYRSRPQCCPKHFRIGITILGPCPRSPCVYAWGVVTMSYRAFVVWALLAWPQARPKAPTPQKIFPVAAGDQVHKRLLRSPDHSYTQIQKSA